MVSVPDLSLFARLSVGSVIIIILVFVRRDVRPERGRSDGPARARAGDPGFIPAAACQGEGSVALEVAIRNNAAQEREISKGEMFLRGQHGYVAEPNIPRPASGSLNILEAAPPGDPFKIAFLVFNCSDHQIMAIQRSAECINRTSHATLRD